MVEGRVALPAGGGNPDPARLPAASGAMESIAAPTDAATARGIVRGAADEYRCDRIVRTSSLARHPAQLLEHGLLRPSFVPPPEIRQFADADPVPGTADGRPHPETTRLEGMLEDASIKLSAVASSLTTVSAQAMLGALIAGERDPRVLAGMAKGRMRSALSVAEARA